MDPISLGLMGLSALSSITGGIESRNRAKAEAEEFKRASRQTKALGTRQARRVQRQGERVSSDAVATNAAQGGAMDTGMIERMARLGNQNDYNTLAVLYQADNDARALRYRAKQSSRAGDASLVGGIGQAIPTILDMKDMF